MSAKFTPKYCWRTSPSTTVAMRELNAGHEAPKLMPSRTSATAAAAGVVANASSTVPSTIADWPPSMTTRAPYLSVSAPLGPVTTNADRAMTAISAPDSPSPKPRTSCR